MLLLLATTIIASAAPAALPYPTSPELIPMRGAGANSGSRRSCPPISRYEAGRHSARPKLHHLNELPPADVYRAVYRRIDGCIAPVVVRYGLGHP